MIREPPSGWANISGEYLTDVVVSYFRESGVLIHSVVFADDETGLGKLCEGLSARQDAGEPLVYCQDYDVLENERHRIAPYRTSVCWVHLDRTDRWIEQLDQSAGELVRQLHDGEGSFENFPHYLTFAEQAASLIDLNRERVIALSNLTAWTVFESAAYIEESLTLQSD